MPQYPYHIYYSFIHTFHAYSNPLFSDLRGPCAAGARAQRADHYPYTIYYYLLLLYSHPFPCPHLPQIFEALAQLEHAPNVQMQTGQPGTRLNPDTLNIDSEDEEEVTSLLIYIV